jgi:sugar phosphate isomerase/epimerase
MNGSRRSFIKNSALSSALITLGGGSLFGCNPSGRIKDLGLITGVIREEIKADYKATLKKVAEIGYTYLEIGDFLGPSLKEFKAFLQDINLIPIAGGTNIANMMDVEKLKKMIEDALLMEKEYLICYWPWMDDGLNKKLEDFLEASERLNIVGEQCKKMGIKFAFHNHDLEFVEVEGYQWGYEAILENTDPGMVDMQLDLYWIIEGGGDPLYLFDKYPGRYKLFHVKDKDMEKEPRKSYTCPGYGVIDFVEIFSKSEAAGVEYYIVEIDKHPEPMQCIEDSYNYLSNLRF